MCRDNSCIVSSLYVGKGGGFCRRIRRRKRRSVDERLFACGSEGKDKNEGNNGNQEVFCKALLKQIGVLADGSLVPCCLDHNGDVILGNLLHQSLEEILSSPRAQAMIEGFKHHTATEALCQNCESALVRNSFRGKARS